ncbi:MAG TPA: hypothetical protein IAC91_01315, partial [Candidatus Faecimorpha stercoravium]|nr:hypothetical protein [Candidatus Faecimorpha stercoravium]
TAIPYGSTLSQSGVVTAYAVHGLSNGCARIMAALSVAAGIPPAAAVKLSRCRRADLPPTLQPVRIAGFGHCVLIF